MNGDNSFGTQQGAVYQYRHSARDYIISLLEDEDSYNTVAQVQTQRLAVGYERYRDHMWHLTSEQLLGVLIKELADALNFCACMLAKEGGQIG